MSMKYLGESFDIHTGGIDLVFPHHQNEIAQSEGATGKPYVQFWMHNEFVNVDGQSMSKSLGNQTTLREMAESPDDIRAYRYLVVTSHYRTVVNFTEQVLDGARNALRRLDRLRQRLGEAARGTAGGGASPALTAAVGQAMEAFGEGMDDDLNTPRAMAAIWGLVGEVEKQLSGEGLSGADAAVALNCLDQAGDVLGIFYRAPGEEERPVELPPELAQLVSAREDARRDKDWARADELRDQLSEAGVEVRDSPEGTEWSWK
jgi:cysteinyl-tRNA synthetase